MSCFSNPTKVISTFDMLESLDTSTWKRVLLITDKVMIKLGLCTPLCDKLKSQNIEITVFDSVEPDPSIATVQKGTHLLLSLEVDTIIALGGGSVIDAAKAIIYFSLETFKKLGIPKPKPFFVAIPSTSGTGSEVTAYTVITDGTLKIPLKTEVMIPDIAVLDPHFTMSIPPHITADTGMDVLTHALESFVCTKATAFTKPYAEYAIQQVFTQLPECVHNGSNSKARLAMHEASCIAGIAFTNSGLGLTHAMAHALGGIFKIPHGRSNAVLLPHILEYNASTVYSAYAYLAHALELTDEKDEHRACLMLISAVSVLSKTIKIPQNITELGIDKEEFLRAIPQMTQNALNDICLITNPRQVSQSDIEQLYLKLV